MSKLWDAKKERQQEDERDYMSDIAKFSLLKTLFINMNLIHMNDIEVTYWHLINMKMLEEGLWGKYKFVDRNDYQEFSDILLMTALMAKKLCNSEEEFEIFQEFVFHNMDEASG